MTVLLTIIAIVLVALAADLLFILPTQWLKVEHVTWTRSPNTKIVQISDLHIERNRSLQKILQVVAQERPDYIFLTGDYLDSIKAMPKLKRFIERLTFYRIPVYAVLGNHDYLLDDVTPLLQLMERNGIRVLRNESISLPEFELIGIDDFCTEHADVQAAFQRIQPTSSTARNARSVSKIEQNSALEQAPHRLDEPRVPWTELHRSRFVITHDPNVVLSIQQPYDALISGHLHGKQFNVPFLFLLQPMGPLARQGIYKGVHSSPYGNFYISKGAGQSGYNARLFVRSEITLHFF